VWVASLRDTLCEIGGQDWGPLCSPACWAPSGTPSRVPVTVQSFVAWHNAQAAIHLEHRQFHLGDLPRQPAAINDLEVCKMIVAITRTRKQCHLIYARRWGNNWKRPSPFLGWIRPERREQLRVTRSYW
jgi:hypothetical protein